MSNQLNLSDKKNANKEHIEYILENDENSNEIGFNINDLMSEFNDIKMSDETQYIYDADDMYASITDYDENYNIKQLCQICEFYGFNKEVKSTKSKKLDIIGAIVMFENNSENSSIVYRRKQLWCYINELKRDKFMKRFVIW
jgi:hypothetical protein